MAKFTAEVTADKITYSCEAFGKTWGFSMIRQRDDDGHYTGQWKGDKPSWEKQVKVDDDDEFVQALDEATDCNDFDLLANFFDMVGSDIDWPVDDEGRPLSKLPEGYVYPDHAHECLKAKS